MNVLSEAFSRGFTTAYLKGKRGNEIMSYGRPNNRGVFVGRVAKVREGLVFIDPETELHVGDLIEFWTNRGHFVHTIEQRQGLKVACLEEIAFNNGWLTREQVIKQAERLQKTGYGQYLFKLLQETH